MAEQLVLHKLKAAYKIDYITGSVQYYVCTNENCSLTTDDETDVGDEDYPCPHYCCSCIEDGYGCCGCYTG